MADLYFNETDLYLEMKKVLNSAFTLTLTLSLVFSTGASAADCGTIMTPLATTAASVEVNHWKDEARRAHRDNNPEGEVYALLNLALGQSKDLHLMRITRNEIRKMLLDLELLSLDRELVAHGRSAAFGAKLLHFLGLTHFMQADVFGVVPNSKLAHRSKTLKTLAGDAFFSMGPFFFSLARLGYLTSGSGGYSLGHVVTSAADHNSLIEEFAKGDGVSFDDAWNTLSSKWQKVKEQTRHQAPRKAWYLGRALLPWIAALSVFFTQGMVPRQYLAFEAESHLMPSAYAPYVAREYLADATKQIGDLAAGRVLIAYSDDLFAKIDFRENAPMAVPEMRRIGVGHLDTFKISKISDLRKANLAAYDNVIIFSHGLPDEIGVGFDGREIPKLKAGANLIYFSCLLGQKGGRLPGDEEWVRFSSGLLNGGKAIASTQILWTDIEAQKAGRSLHPAEEMSKGLMEKGLDLVPESLGLAQIIDGVFNLTWALNDQYYFSPKGIRVYDSQTGHVTYVPSVSP